MVGGPTLKGMKDGAAFCAPYCGFARAWQAWFLGARGGEKRNGEDHPFCPLIRETAIHGSEFHLPSGKRKLQEGFSHDFIHFVPRDLCLLLSDYFFFNSFPFFYPFLVLTSRIFVYRSSFRVPSNNFPVSIAACSLFISSTKDTFKLIILEKFVHRNFAQCSMEINSEKFWHC